MRSWKGLWVLRDQLGKGWPDSHSAEEGPARHGKEIEGNYYLSCPCTHSYVSVLVVQITVILLLVVIVLVFLCIRDMRQTVVHRIQSLSSAFSVFQCAQHIKKKKH